MKFFKLLFLVVAAAFLSACSSGKLVYEPVVDKNGEVQTNSYGVTVKKKTKVSSGVAIMDGAAVAVKEVAKSAKAKNACETLNFEQLSQLSEAVQTEYVRGVTMCNTFGQYTKGMGLALNRPQFETEAVARAFGSSVNAVEKGKTARTKAIVNPAFKFLTVDAVVGELADGQQGGDTTINGNISQSSGSGARGIAGGAGGAGTETAQASQNLIIGDSNNTATAFDEGRAGRNLLENQESATGAINDDSKPQGSPVADENNAASDFDDSDGLNL